VHCWLVAIALGVLRDLATEQPVHDREVHQRQQHADRPTHHPDVQRARTGDGAGYGAVAIMKRVSKYGVEVSSTDAISEVVADAFRAAESGRPGAAFISPPIDIIAAPATGEVLTPVMPDQFGAADALFLDKARRAMVVGVGLAHRVRRGTREVEGRKARVVPGSKAVVCIGRV
jgi:hypothetical protein